MGATRRIALGWTTLCGVLMFASAVSAESNGTPNRSSEPANSSKKIASAEKTWQIQPKLKWRTRRKKPGITSDKSNDNQVTANQSTVKHRANGNALSVNSGEPRSPEPIVAGKLTSFAQAETDADELKVIQPVPSDTDGDVADPSVDNSRLNFSTRSAREQTALVPTRRRAIPVADEPPKEETETANDRFLKSFNEDKKRCEEGITELSDAENVVAKISINISPPNLSEKTVKEKNKLSGEIREWRDISGDMLWNAHAYGFEFPEKIAVFKTAEGEIKRIGIDELSARDKLLFHKYYSIPLECQLGTRYVNGKLVQIEPPSVLSRDWAPSTFAWKASGACHNPLYFEQVHLERYGHTRGPFLTPILSAAHFFGTLPVLPYKMGLKPPTECVYTLGYYRPGSCAPYLLDPIPLSVRAGLWQAGAWVGGVSLIP